MEFMYVKYMVNIPFMCNKSTVYGCESHYMCTMFNTFDHAHWAYRISQEDLWMFHWDPETLVRSSCLDPRLVWEGVM